MALIHRDSTKHYSAQDARPSLRQEAYTRHYFTTPTLVRVSLEEPYSVDTVRQGSEDSHSRESKEETRNCGPMMYIELPKV